MYVRLSWFFMWGRHNKYGVHGLRRQYHIITRRRESPPAQKHKWFVTLLESSPINVSTVARRFQYVEFFQPTGLPIFYFLLLESDYSTVEIALYTSSAFDYQEQGIWKWMKGMNTLKWNQTMRANQIRFDPSMLTLGIYWASVKIFDSSLVEQIR